MNRVLHPLRLKIRNFPDTDTLYIEVADPQ
jgi:hypothetical protein